MGMRQMWDGNETCGTGMRQCGTGKRQMWDGNEADVGQE